MNKTALYFPTIVELVDFSLAMSVKNYEVDRSKLAIIAAFPNTDIELATQYYKAKVVLLSPTNEG